MGKTVSISEYWQTWLSKIVSSGLRKSKAEIVEEGLKQIQYGIDRKYEEWEEAKQMVYEKREGAADE